MLSKIFNLGRELLDDRPRRFRSTGYELASLMCSRFVLGDDGDAGCIPAGDSGYYVFLTLSEGESVLISTQSQIIFRRGIPSKVLRAAKELDREHDQFNCFVSEDSSNPRVHLIFRCKRLEKVATQATAMAALDMVKLILKIDKSLHEEYC